MLRVLNKATVGLLFLAISILAFGLQIPWLGYYVDDWIILQAYNSGGLERLFEYAFRDNRPVVFWLWGLGFELFGSSTVAWHIWALFWRWLAVVMVWLGWQHLWPKARYQTTLAALIFAVYPLFTQQPTALTYSFHWICFFLWALSVYWMIRSVQEPRRFVPFTVGAILSGGVQLFAQEFYVGLELLRPVILWVALLPLVAPWKARLGRVLRAWLPYLVLFGLYLAWRLVWMPVPGDDRNEPTVLLGLLSQPVQTIIRLAEMFFQDMVEILVGAWFLTISPAIFTASLISSLMAWGTAVAAFLLLVWLIIRPFQRSASGERLSPSWHQVAVPFGLVAMIFGFLPGWAIGRHIYDPVGAFNDRFGLAAMLGASLVVIGLLDYFLRKDSQRVILACLLVSLAVGHHFRSTTQYRWSWEKQRQLFWQLKWRAPSIQARTAILGEGALVGYIGSWANTSAFNQMYGSTKDTRDPDYWYLDLHKYDVSTSVDQGLPISDYRKFLWFTNPADHSLLISFEPEKDQCLWVLAERDFQHPYLSEKLRQAMPLSNPGRILASPDPALRADIFGAEPPRTWCYYYQKADLAAQTGDWAGAVDLWQQAQQAGLRPGARTEYAPFIEAALHSAEWDLALELSKEANVPDYEMWAYNCRIWQVATDAMPPSEDKTRAIASAVETLQCQGYLQSP